MSRTCRRYVCRPLPTVGDDAVGEADPLDWSAPFDVLLRVALPGPHPKRRSICPWDRLGKAFVLPSRSKYEWKPPCRQLYCGCTDKKVEKWRQQMIVHAAGTSPHWEEGMTTRSPLKELKSRWVDDYAMDRERLRARAAHPFWQDNEPRLFWTRYRLAGNTKEDNDRRKKITDRVKAASKSGSVSHRYKAFYLHDGWVHVIATCDVTNRTPPTAGRWLSAPEAMTLVGSLLVTPAVITCKPTGTRKVWTLEDPVYERTEDVVELGDLPRDDESAIFYDLLEDEIGVDLSVPDATIPEDVPLDSARTAWRGSLASVSVWRVA
jgi:hypothetical protein